MTINDTNPVLHRIRIKLYPNRLKGRIKGAYIARTASNRTLTIDEVCALAKQRGGYSGRAEEMAAHVRRYFEEAAYNLCDGFRGKGWDGTNYLSGIVRNFPLVIQYGY